MRLVCSVLISVVAGLMVPGECAGQFFAIPANGIVPMTKAGGSRLAEAVVIENSSPHVEKWAWYSEGVESARWGGDRSAALYHCCSRRDDIIPLSFGSIDGEISQTAGGINSESDYPRNITGRQISYVFDSNMSHSTVSRSDHANNANWFDAQISSLEQARITCLPTGESFNKFQLTFTSLPQSPCREPQCEGEGGNHHSCQGCDVVVSSAFQDKTDKTHDPFKEGGAGLVIGIVIGGLFFRYLTANSSVF